MHFNSNLESFTSRMEKSFSSQIDCGLQIFMRHSDCTWQRTLSQGIIAIVFGGLFIALGLFIVTCLVRRRNLELARVSEVDKSDTTPLGERGK